MTRILQYLPNWFSKAEWLRLMVYWSRLSEKSARFVIYIKKKVSVSRPINIYYHYYYYWFSNYYRKSSNNFTWNHWKYSELCSYPQFRKFWDSSRKKLFLVRLTNDDYKNHQFVIVRIWPLKGTLSARDKNSKLTRAWFHLLFIRVKSWFWGTKKFWYILKLFKNKIQSLKVSKFILYYRKIIKYEKNWKITFFT